MLWFAASCSCLPPRFVHQPRNMSDTTNNVRRAHALLAELHARGYSVFHHTRGAHKNNPGMREISLIRRTPCKRFDCHSDLWAVECPK